MSHSNQDPLQTPQRTMEEGPSGRTGASGLGPKSSYYQGPPPQNSAFGTAPVGVIGRDKPREIIRSVKAKTQGVATMWWLIGTSFCRVERDYTGGELCQFHPTFPLELEGRVSDFTL